MCFSTLHVALRHHRVLIDKGFRQLLRLIRELQLRLRATDAREANAREVDRLRPREVANTQHEQHPDGRFGFGRPQSLGRASSCLVATTIGGALVQQVS